MDNIYLTAKQVAEILQVSESWLYRKCKARIVPHVKIGSVTRFLQKDIDEWVESHRIKGCQKI